MPYSTILSYHKRDVATIIAMQYHLSCQIDIGRGDYSFTGQRIKSSATERQASVSLEYYTSMVVESAIATTAQYLKSFRHPRVPSMLEYGEIIS